MSFAASFASYEVFLTLSLLPTRNVNDTSLPPHPTSASETRASCVKTAPVDFQERVARLDVDARLHQRAAGERVPGVACHEET